MISILIPTYNYNIVPLVNELYKEVTTLNIVFEILVYDDASQSSLNILNASINSLNFCIFKELPFNIGRSAIRNLLAADSKYTSLLFIDAGTFPKNINFIENYLTVKNKKIVIGGMTHLEHVPEKPYRLRWVYTKNRESISPNNINNNKVICSSNFFIDRQLFLLNPFDESITKYGCEDVVFFNKLIKNNQKIHHIYNPVVHDSKDDANTFIKKTEQAIENLVELIALKKLKEKHYRLSALFPLISKFKLTHFTIVLFKISKPLLIKNFNSSYPSLLLFDFYRLGYFCYLKTKK